MDSPENIRPKALPMPPRAGLHLHIGGHPDHGAFFRNHGFVGVHVADDHGHGFAGNVVAHKIFFLLANQYQASIATFLPSINSRYFLIPKLSALSPPEKLNPILLGEKDTEGAPILTSVCP